MNTRVQLNTHYFVIQRHRSEARFHLQQLLPYLFLLFQVRFSWGADIAGQNICRDAVEGFPLMEALNAVEGMDFFLNIGDAIYGNCTHPPLLIVSATRRHQYDESPQKSQLPWDMFLWNS